jgi:peptidoglycan/LPS O-acetylase OafA/YrhL
VLCAARITVESKNILHFTPFVYIGKISNSIYMSHCLLMDLLRRAGLYYTGKTFDESLNLMQQISVIALSTLFIILLSSLLYHKIETPMRNRIMGR